MPPIARPCTTCGAALHHDPSQATASLTCGFCGSRHPFVARKAVPARPLAEAAALDGAYHDKLKSARCPGCGVRLEVHGEFVSSACPYCGGPQLTVEGEGDARLPDAIVPFRLSRENARAQWQKWFADLGPGGAPPELKACAAVYLPFWVFTVETEAPWSADVGFKERRTVTDVDGNARTEVIIRWVHEEGVFREASRCEPVYGGTLELGRMGEIISVNEDAMLAFEPALAAGLTIDGTRFGPAAAWKVAERQLVNSFETRLSGTLTGDTHRNFEAQPAFSKMAFRSALLPLYVLLYEHDGGSYRCLINGLNGQTAGGLPADDAKSGARGGRLPHYRAEAPLEGLREAGVKISHSSTSSKLEINGIDLGSTAGERFELQLPSATKLDCAFGPETATKKLVKLFKRELQVGDDAFDRAVYVTTNDEDTTRRFLRSAEVRNLIVEFVGEGGTVAVLGDRVMVHAVSKGTIALVEPRDVARFACHVMAFD